MLVSYKANLVHQFFNIEIIGSRFFYIYIDIDIDR